MDCILHVETALGGQGQRSAMCIC